MRSLFISLVALVPLCASCVPNCRDTTLYQHSGRRKAIVSVLPVIDRGGEMELTWDLSQEFTEEIRKRMHDSPKVYLLRDPGNRELAEVLSTPNPAHIPAEPLRTLGPAEFVVVAELIDQKELPYGTSSDSASRTGSSLLGLCMRVRVIDVRRDQPKVVLQEILSSAHLLAGLYAHIDYAKSPWGTEAFWRTPLGFAHHKMVRELVARVENYIEAAR